MELRDTEWGKILLLRGETGHVIPCFLEKGEIKKALTLAFSVVDKSSHGYIEMTIKIAFELGLDDPESQVEDAESLLRRTWISILFEDWLKAVDAKAWMTREDLEAALMEIALVTPIMDS